MRVRAERESCGRGEVGRGGFPALPCDRLGLSGGVQPLAARVAGRILCLHGGLGAGLVDIDQIRALQRRAARPPTRTPPHAGCGAVVCAPPLRCAAGRPR
jgi:hypothetical protein